MVEPDPDEPDCPMLPELEDPVPLEPDPEPLPPPLCPTAAPAAASEPAAIKVPTILRKLMSASVGGSEDDSDARPAQIGAHAFALA